ncbi:unnamed protein product [Lampetra fluviatilis]
MANAALNACRHHPGEDLGNYAEDVRSLTQSAHSGYAAEIIDDLAAKKVQQYLLSTSWWQPDVSCTCLTFNTLIERARACERFANECAQFRGLGRERTIASLLSEEEEHARMRSLQKEPGGHPVGMEPASRGPTGCSAPPDHIQEDVGCASPGLDNEQLRQALQRDPDLVALEAALREAKVALEGP